MMDEENLKERERLIKVQVFMDMSAHKVIDHEDQIRMCVPDIEIAR